MTNLNRQQYSLKDLGQYKTEALRSNLRQIRHQLRTSQPPFHNVVKPYVLGTNVAVSVHMKTKIRDRAGRYTYSLGLLVVCFSILVFGILGALEVIDNARMIVLYLSGYLLFQVIAGIVIFNKLMKKY